MSEQDPQVGDRFITTDGKHLVISSIEGSLGEVLQAQVRVLDPETRHVAFRYYELPFPEDWTFCGGSTVPAAAGVCDYCGVKPPAPGMIYCDDCIDEIAPQFALWPGVGGDGESGGD